MKKSYEKPAVEARDRLEIISGDELSLPPVISGISTKDLLRRTR